MRSLDAERSGAIMDGQCFWKSGNECHWLMEGDSDMAAPQMKPVETLDEILRTVRELQSSQDRLSIRITGVKYNGHEEIMDKSGGELGRLAAQFQLVKATVKAHGWMIVFLMAMIGLQSGIGHAKTIANFFSKALAP
jgi:hypothetical protein